MTETENTATAKLSELIGTYGLQCAMSGELAPNHELVDEIKAIAALVRSEPPTFAIPECLLDSYDPPEAAIRAGGDQITATVLQAMAQEELHPDDIALRIWHAMRTAGALSMKPVVTAAPHPTSVAPPIEARQP